MLFRHLTGLLHKHGRISKGTLKRSSSTNLLGINSGSRGQLGGHTRIYSHVVVTLDPNKFAEKKQQRLHIGGLQAFDPYIMLRNQSSPVTPFLAPRLVYDMARMSGKREILAYPPDTKAFLYYYTSREIPRIAGELRLRVASSDDPASFESGSDLLKTNGQIWSRPLYVVSKCYAPLYEILREDQLVPEDLHSTLSTLPPVSPRYRRRHILYTLNDEFIVDFSGARSLCIITEQGVEKLLLFGPFAEERFGRPLTAPYTGSALVRFERSTLPEHNGTRSVVLRFLKIIRPVECVMPSYDGYIAKPKEGELHRRSRMHTVKTYPPVWSVNIDKKKVMMRGLQLLWDT